MMLFHYKKSQKVLNQLHNAQKQLKEEAEIFNRNVIVSESNLEGKITYVNQKFCEITGYSEKELIGQSHNIFRSPNTPSSFYRKLWETITENKTFHGIFQNKKKDGSFFWTDTSISPIVKNHKVVGYKAIRFDLTEHALTQKGLQTQNTEQAKRFEFAINSSRDGFWDYDVTKNEFYLSSNWKKRLGFKENEKLTYLDYLALMPDEKRAEHHHAMDLMLDTLPNDLGYAHFRIRYPIVTKNGEKLMIEDVGDAFFDHGEVPSRITGFHRDITETEHQAKMLEAQNRMNAMGEMISNIAHQWRQPLGAINNTLNELEFDIELEDLEQIDTDRFLQSSQKIKQLTAHMSQTIDDFRTISSDEKVKTVFALREVLDEAYAIVTNEYLKNSIELNIININECKCILEGYKRELLQVILNILNNAKDVVIENHIQSPKVEIIFSKDTQNVYLSIHDNAGGIPEAIMEKIFDPYFTTKHESVGTGIGLYMSKKIITKHFEGTLEVKNENNGAKFTISLPRDKRVKETNNVPKLQDIHL